jgi:hypothetical protein
MQREETVAIIEGLYPADARVEDTRHIGQQLLNQAKREAIGWRTEPTYVLLRYAQLCISKQTEMSKPANW